MSKTLADMTAEERAGCVGMWTDAMGQGLGVIVNATELSDCWVLFPEDGGSVATCRNQRVTPRYDLPRAWTPDGAPVKIPTQELAEETWEYSYQELRGDEWETAFNDVTHLEEWWPKKSDVDWIVEEARKHGYVCRLVRRRVSPPEIVNE